MTETGIKRILIALDAGEFSRSALLTAGELARQLQTELEAVFVEDDNLLRLAELPFARELMPGRHESRRLTLTSMQHQMAAQARRLRQLVEATSQQSRVSTGFRILHGSISTELQQATQRMDLLILGKRAHSLKQIPRLGQVALDLLAGANCDVLLLQHGANISGPVAVLYADADRSQRALQLAFRLAQDRHDRLSVIYPAVDDATQETRQAQVNLLARTYAVNVEHSLLHANTSDAVLDAIDQGKSRMLIMQAGTGPFMADATSTIIQQSPVPVIIMR